ncbi:MAG: hypothetical protein IH899_11595 [Planctomycetes bacterium]|nr:hypothetical protein [Planctomycetota bacterium]
MIPNTGVRVLDTLNDAASAFLMLEDAQLFREEHRDHSIATFSEVVVPKERISLVVIPRHEHEAPDKRRHARVEKRSCQGLFVVPRYSVRGDIHLTGLRDDSLYTLVTDLGGFFPVTNATIGCPSGKSISAPVVIANKSKVDCFCLGRSLTMPLHQDVDVVTEACFALLSGLDLGDSIRPQEPEAFPGAGLTGLPMGRF